MTSLMQFQKNNKNTTVVWFQCIKDRLKCNTGTMVPFNWTYWTIVSTTLPTLSLALQIPLFFSLLRQFFCSHARKIQNSVKATSIVAFICTILFNAIAILLVITIYIEKSKSDNKKPSRAQSLFVDDILNAASYIAFFGASYCIYIILLLRVYYTFQDTMYEVKRLKLYVHGINVAITVLIITDFTMFKIYTFDTVSAVTLCIWMILLTIGYIHLLYIFNHNLFILVLTQRHSLVILDEEEHAQKQILNQRQRSMLSTIRKHGILGSYMIFCNLFCAVTNIIFAIADTKRDWDYMIELVLYYYFYVISLYIFSNTGPICIYLGFQQNRYLYQKCCGLCDRKCKNICNGLAEKQMNKHTDYIQMLDSYQ